MSIFPFLTFNGNCREAMKFYKDSLGGELTFQSVGESPMAEFIPSSMKNYILHASLIKSNFKLMASDLVGESGLIKGNAISLLLNCNSEKEINDYFSKLSKGGESTNPINKNNWGALSGDLIDKFGESMDVVLSTRIIKLGIH